MEEIIEKLKEIKDMEVKYKKLCELLGLEIKAGNSKKSQINNLRMYCELQELDNPKRYCVKRVYDKELEILGLNDNRNKFQLMFDAAVYQAFINNNGEPLYLSNMDAIKLFREVNDNFTYACNTEQMKKMGTEYEFMPEVGKIIYRILRQWTIRRIDSMNRRHTALKETGYRLYKTKEYNGNKYTTFLNVPINSELSKKCQAIYNKAIEEIMPEGWAETPNEEEIKIEGKDETKQKSGKYWVPDYVWLKFEKRIQQMVQEEFEGNYDNLKAIIVLKPPTSQYVKERLEILCQKLQAITHINEEACQKALTTTQLDHITTSQRKKFVEINMSLKTTFSFRDELRKQ